MKRNLLFNQLTAICKRLAMLLTVLFTLSVGSMWGADGDILYTLSFTTLSSGSNYNNYGTAHTITVSNKTWSVTGNQSLGNFLGVGGKDGSNTNRVIFSTSQIGSKVVKKVTITNGGTGGTGTITLNSIKLEVASNSNFSTIVDTKTISSPTKEGQIEFIPTSPLTVWPENSYYRITYNYKNSQTSKNGYVKVNSVTFYEGATAPAYTVTVTSNNNNYGTVSVSGTTITATPKTGYTYASPAYTVTSGTATVSQSGNTFKVTPSSNCAVQINFAEKVKNTYVDQVQGNSNKVLYDTHDAPSLTDKAQATTGTCEQQHWHFMGWVTEANKANPTDANIVKASTSVTADGTTYYAVWAKGVTSGGASTSKQYSFDITPSNFNGTSYDANNNEKTSTAKASDNSTFEVKWTSKQVMLQNSAIQWQKSKGYIYNSTDLGTINSVTVTSTAGTYTTYYGTSEQPSSGTAGDGKGYFKTSVGSATGTASKVTVTFTKTTQGTQTTTYSDYITQCITETTVTLDLDGGSFDSKPDGWEEDGNNYTKTVNSGDQVTLPEPNKTGHDFEGWYNASTKVTSPYTLTGNTTLTAHWTPQDYTITYKDQGDADFSGTHENNYPTQHTYGTATTLKSATKSGYNFLGWFTTSDCSGSAITQLGATAYTSNITLYAKWEKAKTATSLTWSAATYSATIDADNTFPTLTKTPADLSPIAYSSTNTGVATIDVNTGEITLKAAGTTTITATFTETNTHAGSTASYTLTVHPSNCRWVETDIANINSSDEVVVAMETATGTYALNSKNGTTGAPEASIIYPEGNKISTYEVARYNSYIIWNIDKDGDNLIFHPFTEPNKNLYCNTAENDNNRVRVGSSNNAIINHKFIISGNHLQNNITNHYLGIYYSNGNAQDWRGYLNSTQFSGQTLKFYKKECLPTGEYWINYDLTNVVCTDDPIKNKISTDDDAVELNFEAVGEHNELPATITVTNGSTTLAKNTDYTWSNGVLTILNPSQITDNITISIAAQKRKYTVTFDANGHGTAPAAQSVTAEGIASVPTAPEATGYTFVGWYTDSECTNVFDFATPITGDITLYAKWTVKQYNVTLSPNYPAGKTGTFIDTNGNSVDGNLVLSYFYNTISLTLTDLYQSISLDGYQFNGWYNATAGGSKWTATGTITKDITLYAQWTPTYTITWLANGQEFHKQENAVEGTALDLPDSEPDAATYACDDKVFVGWTDAPISGTTDDEPADLFTTKTANVEDAATTYYAVFATADGSGGSGNYEMISSDPTDWSGDYLIVANGNCFDGSRTTTIDAGGNYKSVTISNNEITSNTTTDSYSVSISKSTNNGKYYIKTKSGYYIGSTATSDNELLNSTTKKYDNTISISGNDVTIKGTNSIFRFYVQSGQTPRFRYYKGTTNTVLPQLYKKSSGTSYSDYTTSPACDPMITIGSEAPVMVTSAKDIRVDAVQNITISATNLDQNADKAQVSIKIVSDNSAFKFKEVGANGDGQATSTWTGIANATFDKTLCVTYTPTVAGQEETATLRVTAYRHNGSTEYATATMQVRGRSLPEQFVLVANTGDGWVALPNTLGTGSTASIPYPIAVEVDNDANPTSIPLAPSTTIYKAAARSTVNAIPTGLRFTTETGGYMQASTTETNIWLASNNSENMQSWTLNSTDFVDYSIRVNNAAEGHYLNYSNTQKKIGNYKSDNKLRILPIEAICEQHAAPEDIEASSVRATSATIQWSAVSTATAGYEYRIGDTGEWTKIGNVTELEITGLNSLTNYTIYVRASVEGAIINCSNEAEVSFTTVNCDDVPTNITHTSSSQSITVSWEAKAATSIVKLYSDKEGTTEVKSIESSSPCTLSDLEKYTTYYVQILAGGRCPSQIIEVSTLLPNINIAEWMEDGILVDVNTDEDVSVIIENEESYGSGSGQVAEDLFFSKYFEATGNVKLLALYNGTNADIDLTQYSIKFSNKGKDYTGSNYTEVDYEATVDLSEDLPENRRTLIAGQELILISYANDGSSNSKPITNPDGTTSNVNQSDYGVLACAAENKQESGWDRYIRVTSPALNFSGNDAIALYKNTELIDIIGGGNASKANMTTVVSPAQTFMDAAGWYNAAGYEIVDLKPSQNKDYALSTNRCLLVRLNSVISGAKAVEKNTTDFVTLGGEFGEWMGKQIPDDNAACDGFKYVGGYNYSEYYTKYNTVGSEQVFPGEERKDGTVKITIDNLANYSCHNIKLNLKIGEDLKITQTTKVPILISSEETTQKTSTTLSTLRNTLGVIDPLTQEKRPLDDNELVEKCEECDIVVLANGRLTHEAEGIAQFNDLTIYPNGVFRNTSNFNVNRLLIHAQNDEVGCAIIENEGVTLTTNAIAHTKRIDAQYWYPFSLPYNCNIADITQANGESLGTYGVHWGIQYYDGKKRQASGTSAGAGHSSSFWTPIYNSNEQLKEYQGYMIALFDASVSSPTEMRTIYFPPVSAQMYTESGTDRKETTITSWNINLAAETRHHGWNFTGSPYISVFNPQASGLTQDYGLAAEVLMISGHYDPETNEYLYDDNNVYVSVPSPNGAKYYDQYITSATSLKPFTAYFVQAIDPTSGNDETQTLAYAKAGRELPSSAPARAAATKQRVLVELNITAPDGQTDNTGIWVDERYTTDYEIAADLTKMYATGTRPQLYTLAANNEKLAYNALPDNAATYIPLGLYAPVAGDYTLTLDERVSRTAGAESVELLYNNQLVANLLYQDYTITANKGTVNGYSLSIRRRAGVSTAVDNTTGNTITVIANDGYISLVGVPTDAQVSIYDMVGRLINTQYANGETVVNMPIVPQGVYNIVVANDNGYTTIKSVVK